MCGFGDRMQYSVFRCELNAAERVLLEATLTPIINAREDQVIVVPLGPPGGRNARRIVSFGRPYEEPERRIVVV
jgi:CRISPR-associated protein Cas2